MIYADNAATTELCREAYEAMQPYLLQEYGNASQPYSFAKSPKKALDSARETIASCIGADPEEIYFTSGGTESDNAAIKSVLFTDGRTKVVTSQIEHHAVLNSCRSLEELQVPVHYLRPDKEGIITPSELSENIHDASLVSVMMANNEIGTIEPIRELAEIAHANGAVFHTDAVQAAGHININVRDLGVDMLSASAHKFNGMKGCGFLYIRKGVSVHSFMDGGAQEHRMRAGTENIPGIAAMAAALKTNCDRIQSAASKLRTLESVFLNRLREAGIDFIRNGSENHLPGNVNISIRNAEGEMLLHRLDLKGICISTGSACDSVNTQVSHVIKAIGVPEEYAEGTIRISFGWKNTENEAMEIADAIIDILKK